MGAPRRLQIYIELDGPAEPIRGQLEAPSGDSASFSGWIGLVAAIEAAHAAPPHAQTGDGHGENRARRADELRSAAR